MRLIQVVLFASVACAQGLWETRTPYPVALTEVASAALNQEIYSLCGITAQGSTSALYIYNPRTDSWRTGPDYPVPGGGDHCNVAAANGKLYLLGAIRIGSPFIDGNTYEYDPATNRWTTVAQMQVPRGASGVAIIRNKIYVAGGLSSAGSVSAFEVFDTSTKRWTTLPNMPTARDHLTAQAVGGKFYAIAGRAGRDFATNEEFDPATNTWRARAAAPTARGGVGSGVLNDRIQVFGGEGASGTPQGTFRQNEEYDPVANIWRTLADMPTPRHGLYGATYEGRIFVPGGGAMAGGFFSTAHEVFYVPPTLSPLLSGVRNAASFDSAVAPGSIASLFGERLSFGDQVATQLPLPRRLNTVSVNVNGAAVPLFFAAPNQVNFVVPDDIVAGTATVTLTNAGSQSTSVTMNIIDSSPAIFSLSGDGNGQGAVLIGGTGLVARSANDGLSRPARKGEIVEIYITGLGRSPAATATIGGAAGEVLYAGPTRTFPGLQQVNARVPAGAQSGATVPVSIRIGQRLSNTVTIAVVD